MNTKNKWILAGVLVAVLLVGCTLGVVAVTLMQRTMWGYPPAYAADFAFDRPMSPNGMPYGRMFDGGPRWNGGPMMQPNSHMGYRGSGMQNNFGPGMMGRGSFSPMMGAGPGFGSQAATVAEQLDMTTAELTTALQSGKTIADVAQENDVPLNNIVDALLAPRAERMALAVASGRMTQEQVDTMLEAMRSNLTAQLSGEGTWGGPGTGTCPGFDDADGDGICDHGERNPRGNWGRGMMWR
jgi:hypothetical protein